MSAEIDILEKPFIGRFNVVTVINDVWYQLPFDFLIDECVISKKADMLAIAGTPNEQSVLEAIVDEISSRWEYFEYATKTFELKETKKKQI